jgi:transcriptional regulator with XRE-family HTH domain
MPPSKLGEFIRSTRMAKDISLREFARMIGKSPAFVTELECDEMPSVSEDTLKKVAEELQIDHARLFVLAERTPRELAPGTDVEYALYRKVKGMAVAEQERFLKELGERRRR